MTLSPVHFKEYERITSMLLLNKLVKFIAQHDMVLFINSCLIFFIIFKH
jgi:hypothetical protein